MTCTPSALRTGTADDATTIAALAVQVFLDTYATEGVRPDLAREAFGQYSAAAFAARLDEKDRRFLLAEQGSGLEGFAEVLVSETRIPGSDQRGAELVRLYVQPRAQGRGLGRALLGGAERLAAAASLHAVWLTVWEGNARALVFYARAGYAEVGSTTYAFEGRTYGNRVLARRLSAGSGAGSA